MVCSSDADRWKQAGWTGGFTPMELSYSQCPATRATSAAIPNFGARRPLMNRQARSMSSLGTQPAGERRTPPSLALRTAQGAGWVIVWRMATRVLGLINTLILVRLLLPADFGLVALATSFAQAVDWISTVGVEQALIRETHLDNALYNTGFTMNVIRAVAVGAMIAASAGPVSAFYGDARLMPILLAVAGDRSTNRPST